MKDDVSSYLIGTGLGPSLPRMPTPTDVDLIFGVTECSEHSTFLLSLPSACQ